MLITLFYTAVGAILGSLFLLPMGEMFGAMFLVLLASKYHHSMSLHHHALTFIQIVLGISVGSLVQVGEWQSHLSFGVLFGLITCMTIQTLVGYCWLTQIEKWSKNDSLLGPVPGAMAAILVITNSQSTPSQKVIFTHTVRLVSLMVLASLIAYSTKLEPSMVSTSYIDNLLQVNMLELATAVFTAVGFGFVLERLGVPAPFMITGLLVTAGGHAVVPTVSIMMPDIMVFVAMALLGALVGIRIKSVTLKETLLYLKAGVFITILGLIVTLLIAGAFSTLLDLPYLVLVMSWVPGSIEAMTVTALMLGLEPSFVMLNHIIRLIVLHTLPVLFVRKNKRQT
ncbi:AbrB family transcriptional regulator [Photobacterium sanguinicancri]|uniref:AbrB family transcriptional regulator n=1 Tax=Photobacterium sanguinicancri TaxID=875932 RepID=UPI0021C2FCB2|nr:AbrB family transcriptional regulator [Photobacterium sanguinicancri]